MHADAIIAAQELYDLLIAHPCACPEDAWIERVDGELAIAPDYARWPEGTNVKTIGRLGALARELFADETLAELGL